MPGLRAPLRDRIARAITATPHQGDAGRQSHALIGRYFDPGVCWVWTGAYSKKRGSPRPVIQLAGRGSPIVHVLRVTLAMLEDPSGVTLHRHQGEHACHGPCADYRCVNPFTAKWGTSAENNDDRPYESFLRKDRR